MKSLLIISCSKTKVKTKEKLPAFDLYDGFYYRIIKKMQREDMFPVDADILILSAKYGLIPPSREIKYYDENMTRQQAINLNGKYRGMLSKFIEDNDYDMIIVNLGNNYQMAINGFEDLINRGRNIIYISGRIGERAQKMKDVLQH